jgi:hypothetical protein
MKRAMVCERIFWSHSSKCNGNVINIVGPPSIDYWKKKRFEHSQLDMTNRTGKSEWGSVEKQHSFQKSESFKSLAAGVVPQLRAEFYLRHINFGVPAIWVYDVSMTQFLTFYFLRNSHPMNSEMHGTNGPERSKRA